MTRGDILPTPRQAAYGRMNYGKRRRPPPVAPITVRYEAPQPSGSRKLEPLIRKRKVTPSDLRRQQDRLAHGRQAEWGKGAPDDAVGTGRPGTDRREVARLTDDLRITETALRGGSS